MAQPGIRRAGVIGGAIASLAFVGVATVLGSGIFAPTSLTDAATADQATPAISVQVVQAAPAAAMPTVVDATVGPALPNLPTDTLVISLPGGDDGQEANEHQAGDD